MKLKLMVLCAALLATGAVGAYASIPGSDGTVTACVNSKGALKVIDAEAGETCASGQQALTLGRGVPTGAVHTHYAQSAEGTAAFKSAVAYCPAGSTPTGGGAQISGAPSTAPIAITNSLPLYGSDGWYASAAAMAPTSQSWKVLSYIRCIDVS